MKLNRALYRKELEWLSLAKKTLEENNGLDYKRSVRDAIYDLFYDGVNLRSEFVTVSFDAMDYEGDFFASYDSYELDDEKPELSREEKVRAVLKVMKPRQAELLRLVYLSHYTHERIAAEKGVSRPAVTQQIRTAEAAFKKIFEKLF